MNWEIFLRPEELTDEDAECIEEAHCAEDFHSRAKDREGGSCTLTKSARDLDTWNNR